MMQKGLFYKTQLQEAQIGYKFIFNNQKGD